MKIPRRQFLRLTAGAAALPAFSRVVSAQTYLTRPITMIVPAAAGGTLDVTGRLLAERMNRSLGQPIIIENVSGADGSIGAGRTARARSDGYTIDIGSIGNHVLNGAFYPLQYDVLNDFTPISPLVTSLSVLFARKSMAAKNLSELVAWLKANKASAGTSSVDQRLLTAFFQKQTGTQLTLVPYRGGAPKMQDLAADQIDLSFSTTLAAGAGWELTSETRLALAPNIPTFAEMGLPALSYSAWGGFFAPKGTPGDIVGKLNAAAVEALADPAVQRQLKALGFAIFPRDRQTPEALGALVKADAEKWWPIIKELGIKAE
jgi:tripartite-type tricarboxylate transporter receptor subunit TctC